MATSEVMYYSQGNVQISNARVVLGGVTYAMANITSVAIAEQPANKKPGIALTVVGALIAICTLGSQSAIGGLIFGLILVGIGVLLLISEKPQYFVRLGSASGETNGLVSPDRNYIVAVVNAINEAIVKRG
ncbi:MAG: DUF6232 family protein [Kouleothrix sp.]